MESTNNNKVLHIEDDTPGKTSASFFSRNRNIILALGVSIGVDLMLSTIEMPFIIATFGGALVIEEIVERFVADRMAKQGLPFKITRLDRWLGFLPIPGVTRISVACLRWFLKRK